VAEDFTTAATLFIEHYWEEIYAYLLARAPSEDEASEVMSEFAENFWQGLPDFRWHSSLRSWAYTLARNAFSRYLKEPRRRRERSVPPAQQNQYFATVAEKRTATKKYRRTEIKSRMRRIREKLSDEDQTILVLRVDRKFSWRELAMIISGRGEDMEEREIEQWSARLRQRFRKIKARLKVLAREEGLLD
jgi:RNA polymerase sigma-70 factor (ECF subfamily)